jgi:hypothetical protein
MLPITVHSRQSPVTESSVVLPPDREFVLMQLYRAYVIGQDGHFIRSIDLSCADDNAAIESAKQLIDGHDLELWQRDRRIARFDSKLE